MRLVAQKATAHCGYGICVRRAWNPLFLALLLTSLKTKGKSGHKQFPLLSSLVTSLKTKDFL